MKSVLSKSYWGPQLWESLNVITREYPDYPTPVEKQNYKLFFQAFGDVIPCEECRKNYRKHLQKFSLEKALASRNTLAEFLVNIHNEVNEMKGKPIMPMEKGKRIVLGQQQCIDYKLCVAVALLSGFALYHVVSRP